MMDILDRLRSIQNTSAQYAAGSDIMRDAADEIEQLRAKLAVAEHGLRFVQAEIVASESYYNRALTRIKNILIHSEGDSQ